VKNSKFDSNSLEKIVKKTIDAIDNCKTELYDFAESARKECKCLESELQALQLQIHEHTKKVEELEALLKESKRKLAYTSQNYYRYSQEELRQAYEKADNLRIELAVKREQEQYLYKRRNELETRIKESRKAIEKADRLISQVGVVFDYLTGDLKEISLQLEDMRQKQMLGLRIIKAQEEERQRIARDIHDGPAQSMSNVVLKAEVCERLISIDITKAKEELKLLKSIVRSSLQDVRKIIYNLRPMALDDLGLIPTLERYLATFEDETGIAVVFNKIGNESNIKPSISLAVFRIVQEAVNNIHKHANAKNAIVNIEFLNDNLKLYIFDDGIGFDINKVNNKIHEDGSGGFGLYSMRERVELLNGTIAINSQPGKGTRISIDIPLLQEGEGFNG